VTGSPGTFLLVAVVDALVLGSATGKEKMMCLDDQSDVSRSDQHVMNVWTIQVQTTSLLRTVSQMQ
jgi:hypothetical protein